VSRGLLSKCPALGALQNCVIACGNKKGLGEELSVIPRDLVVQNAASTYACSFEANCSSASALRILRMILPNHSGLRTT